MKKTPPFGKFSVQVLELPEDHRLVFSAEISPILLRSAVSTLLVCCSEVNTVSSLYLLSHRSLKSSDFV